jgi:hypothetical protein
VPRGQPWGPTWTALEPAREGTKLRPLATKEAGWTGNDDDVSRVPARTAPEEEEAATLLQRAPGDSDGVDEAALYRQQLPPDR